MSQPCFPCFRCKKPRSAVRMRTYCLECRGKTPSEFTKPNNDSPWERAVRRIEKVTGTKREVWENRVNHPYGRAANKYAKYLVGHPVTSPTLER